MSKKVIIIGAGGHAKSIANIIQLSGDEVFGFLDDNVNIGTEILDSKVIGKIEDAHKYLEYNFIIGIGNNNIREKIANENNDLFYYTAIHPSAVIAKDVKIGVGSSIMANSVINVSSTIGNHCIINTGAIIEHDNIIQDYVHISPNASLAGTVKVGKYTHIGIGATVINNVDITKDCIIGASACVIKNIDIPGTYVGVPARKIK